MTLLIHWLYNGLLSLSEDLALYRNQFKLVPQRVKSVYRHTDYNTPSETI